MMTANINREQLILLAQCVLFGAGAGLCYDVFRAARRVLCPGRAGETACDALFCVLMLAAAFRFARFLRKSSSPVALTKPERML